VFSGCLEWLKLDPYKSGRGFWKGLLSYRSRELIGAVFVFMKVKRLMSFWYWNSRLFVCKDECILLCVGGGVYGWSYG
jgi:hypothetical protein